MLSAVLMQGDSPLGYVLIGLAICGLCGLPFAALTRPKSFSVLFSRGVGASFCLCLIPYFTGTLWAIDEKIWAISLVVLGILGACIVLVYARRTILRSNAQGAQYRTQALAYTTLFLLAAFAIVLALRPVYEWDAVAYYLRVGTLWALAGHPTTTLEPVGGIGLAAPLALPPLLPSTYSLILSLVPRQHDLMQAAVSMVPFVELLLLWAGVRRIARRLLDEEWSLFAGLLVLAWPGVLFNVFQNPHYLDVAIAAMMTWATAELLDFTEDPNPATALFLGLAFSAAIACKVTGIALVATLCLSALAISLPSVYASRALVSAVVLASIAFAFRERAKSYLVGFLPWTTFCVFALAAVSLARPVPVFTTRWPRVMPAFLIVLGSSFGIATLFILAHLLGSPIAYYAGTFQLPGEAWRWASRAIQAAGVYDNISGEPGVPIFLGIGIALSWYECPPSAPFMLVAIRALWQRRDPVLSLLVLNSLIVIVLWFTVFHSRDYRHLLPILPCQALLVSYGLRERFKRLNLELSRMFVFLLLVAPIGWLSFVGVLAVPRFAIDLFHYTDVYSLGADTLARLGIFGIIAAVITCAPVPHSFRRWLMLRKVSVIEAVGTLAPQFGSLAIAIACSSVLLFPLLLTQARAGGLAGALRTAADSYVQGFSPAVRELVRRGARGPILVYVDGGVEWYSAGRLHPITLLDATNLAGLKQTLRSPNADALRSQLRRAGVQYALFPLETSYLDPRFVAFVEDNHLAALDALLNPLNSNVEHFGDWNIISLSEPKVRSNIHIDLRGYGDTIDLSQAVRFKSLRKVADAQLVIHASGLASVDLYYALQDSSGRTFHHLGKRGRGDVVFELKRLAPPGTWVRIRRVDVVQPVGSVTFHNSGVIYQIQAKGITIDRSPGTFVQEGYHPLVTQIALVNSDGSGILRLYPEIATSPQFSGNGLEFRVDTNNFACNGNPRVRIDVSGKRASAPSNQVKSWAFSKTVNAGDKVTLPIKAPLSWVSFDHISARAVDSSCSRAEDLVSSHVILRRDAKSFVLEPGTSPFLLTRADVPADANAGTGGSETARH